MVAGGLAVLVAGALGMAAVRDRGVDPGGSAVGDQVVATRLETQSDLRSAVAAELVALNDTGSFTDDVARLAASTSGQPFAWGRGLTPPEGRVVHVAVGEAGRVTCLTATARTGVAAFAVIARQGDQERQIRSGPGPMAACDTAAAMALPGTG